MVTLEILTEVTEVNEILRRFPALEDWPAHSSLPCSCLEGKSPSLFPERPSLIHVCLKPVDAWIDVLAHCLSALRAKQVVCEKLMELGASYCMPKIKETVWCLSN